MNAYRNGTTPPGTTNLSTDPGTSRNARVKAIRFPGDSKIMHKLRRNLRVASWNVGSMSGRSYELEEMMVRRRVDILCVQETKWRNTGNRARFLDVKTKAYKMFYYGTEQGKNGVGIILAAKLLSSVLSISKSSDRLMCIKLVMQGEVWNIVSAYAPQIGCEQSDKDAFWLDFHNLIKNIPKEELLFIGGDLNGHVGKSNEDYEDCHGGLGYGIRNTPGEDILSMCKSYGFIVLNTMFIKQNRHLVTYSSGGNETQIDYHLVSCFMKPRIKDCKVILGEAIAQQHRLLLTEIFMEAETNKNKQTRASAKVKWYNLDKEKGEAFIDKMKRYLYSNIAEVDDVECRAQDMWNSLQRPCLDAAKSLLGVSKGHCQHEKETWWWTDEAKAVISEKKATFKAWSKCSSSNGDEKARLEMEYRRCKCVAKKKCAQIQAKSMEGLYRELEEISSSAADRNQANQELRQNDMNKGTTIFKIAAQRRRNAEEIRSPKFINGAQGQLLVEDAKITHRWRQYCEKLLNEQFPRIYFPRAVPNYDEVLGVTVEEVEKAVKDSKKRRAVGPDEIPSEFWKKMGGIGFKWLMILISKLMRGDPMPNQWRESYLLPLYKGKGDTRNCDNYRSIKLMSHTMKIIERVLDGRLRKIIRLSDDQCGFVAGKSTTDAIQSIRIIMEKHRDSLKDLHMVLVDFEKAFDRQPRDLIWVALRKRGVPETYVRIIMDMYEGAKTRVRCPTGVTEEFPIKVGVHQGSVLSPLLFIVVLDYLLEGKVTDPKVHQLFFADDGAIISDDQTSLQRALDVWVDVLEGNGYRISQKKTEYLCCPFSDPLRPIPDIYLNGKVLPKCEKFKYLGSMINSEGTCDDDINHRVSVGWMKWRENSAIFCDRKMPPKLKGRLYTAVVRPALTYGSQCWTAYKKYEDKLTATEMKMLRMTAGVTKLDRIRSSRIRGSLHVKEPIAKKVEHDRLSWYCHVQRSDPSNPAKKAISINVPTQARKRGRPKNSWITQMQKHQHLIGLSDEVIRDREACRYFLRSNRRTPQADQ